MGREGKGSPKYPKEMLKVLDEKLKRISMGQETKCVPVFPDDMAAS